MINIYNRRRKSGRNDFAVSVNMAYGQVKLGTSGDVEGEYEDPDRLAIDLDNVVEGAMNQQDAQLSVNPLVVNQRHQSRYAMVDETTASGK